MLSKILFKSWYLLLTGEKMKHREMLLKLRDEFAETIWDDYDKQCFLRSQEELESKYPNESKAKLLSDHCEIQLKFLKWIALIQ